MAISANGGAGGRSETAVRTLLIDNYDSYTYNLHQLIAEVNGGESWESISDRAPQNDPRAGTPHCNGPHPVGSCVRFPSGPDCCDPDKSALPP